MLNMNSPTVQNLMQSGFNPYANNAYVPQQPMQQPNYYNPYVQPQQVQPRNDLIEWEYYYDPMPDVIVNEARGINTQAVQRPNNINQYYGNNMYYNNQVFNGYMNPIMMRNQMENDRIRQREEAIQQGKIWRALLKNDEKYNENIDETIQNIESLYYNEPIQNEMTMKEKIIVDKNNHIAELTVRLDYYKRNNIPIIDNRTIMYNNLCNYYNHINSIIGDMDNCDMMDYFTRVYPQLKYEQLSYAADKFNKNLKNKYNNNGFNTLVNKVSEDKPDSYYYKIMETFADTGVKLETSNGLVVTADEMEVKIPQRLLKNRQDVYYEQRKKFYDAIFNKEG